MHALLIQIALFLLICQYFNRCLTASCLHIFNVKLTLSDSIIRCQEHEGRHFTVEDLLMNVLFLNQSKNFVSTKRESVWLVDNKAEFCRAVSWNGTAVTVAKIFNCNDKFHPACIFDSEDGTCSYAKKEHEDKINKTTILIASLCAGVIGLICIMILIRYCTRKSRRRGESHEVTSFELKRYRVSEGFNTPVITDDEIKDSVNTEGTEMPYYILEKVEGGSEKTFNLKRTNHWVENQNYSFDESENGRICYHSAPPGLSDDGSDSFYRTDIVSGNLLINNAIVRD